MKKSGRPLTRHFNDKIKDDFGDVYGIYYFLTGEGYTPSELRRYAKQLGLARQPSVEL